MYNVNVKNTYGHAATNGQALAVSANAAVSLADAVEAVEGSIYILTCVVYRTKATTVADSMATRTRFSPRLVPNSTPAATSREVRSTSIRSRVTPANR